jgi:dephospho-CoA kinase
LFHNGEVFQCDRLRWKTALRLLFCWEIIQGHKTTTMLNGKKIVIGLVGESGSGKDTAAEYLKEKYQAVLMRFADPLKETLNLYIDNISRADLQWLSFELRNRFGNKVLSKSLQKRIEDIEEGLIVINGMRVMEDYDFVKSFPNAYVLYVTLDQKSRWQRIYSRGEKSDDAIDFEKFQEMEKAEIEVQIPNIGAKADYRIENMETKQELLDKIDKIIGIIRDK